MANHSSPTSAINVLLGELKDLLMPSVSAASAASASDQSKAGDNVGALVPVKKGGGGGKLAILKIATDVLKLNKALKNATSMEQFAAVQAMDDRNSHLENLGGFFIVLSESGQILYVSQNAGHITPYDQSDLVGSSLNCFVHPDDVPKIRRHLSRKKSKLPVAPTASASASANSQDPPATPTPTPYGERQFFHFRFSMEKEFEHVNLTGRYRRIDDSVELMKTYKSGSGPCDVGTLGEYVFFGILRPVMDRPITELSLMEAIQDQYITRHLPDGKIIFADHRVSTVCGYLPSDLTGKSGFNFIMGEDLPWTTMAQRHMFANLSGEGFATYRLLCKNGEYIVVQTRGYLEFNKHTQKVESFMCVNTMVKPEDGQRFLEEQKDRFTPYIQLYQKQISKEENEKMMVILERGLAADPVFSDTPSLPLTHQDSAVPNVVSATSCDVADSSSSGRKRPRRDNDDPFASAHGHGHDDPASKVARPSGSSSHCDIFHPAYQIINGQRVTEINDQQNTTLHSEFSPEASRADLSHVSRLDNRNVDQLSGSTPETTNHPGFGLGLQQSLGFDESHFKQQPQQPQQPGSFFPSPHISTSDPLMAPNIGNNFYRQQQPLQLQYCQQVGHHPHKQQQQQQQQQQQLLLQPLQQSHSQLPPLRPAAAAAAAAIASEAVAEMKL